MRKESATEGGINALLSTLNNIETEDSIEHEILLNEQLVHIGVYRAVALRKVDDYKDWTLLEILKRKTLLPSTLNGLISLADKNIYPGILDNLEDLLFTRIEELSDSKLSNNSELLAVEITKTISSVFNKLKASIDKEKVAEHKKKVAEGDVNTYGMFKPAQPEILSWDETEIGLKNGDVVLDLHVPSLYRMEKKSGNPLESCRILARAIIEEQMPVDKITGHSWLIGSSVGEAIFGSDNIYTPESFGNEIASEWMQLIGQNGQINKQRTKKLLETGSFPFTMKKGAISVEEFLEKHSPNDMRGITVRLPMYSDQVKKQIELLSVTKRKFKELANKNESVGKILVLVSESKILAQAFDTELGKKIINALNDGLSFDELENKHKNLLVEFDELIVGIVSEMKENSINNEFREIYIPRHEEMKKI